MGLVARSLDWTRLCSRCLPESHLEIQGTLSRGAKNETDNPKWTCNLGAADRLQRGLCGGHAAEGGSAAGARQ